MVDFADALKQHGPWVAMCIYFVWQSWIREGKLGEQLTDVQKYIRETMTVLVAENTSAMLKWREILKERPCLMQDAETILDEGKR